MKLLIVAGSEDFHALAVEYAMRVKGRTVHRLSSDNLTRADTLSLRFDAQGSQTRLDLGGRPISLESIGVVWNRRPYESIQTSPVADEDAPFMRREVSAARDGLYQLLARAQWVNPVESVARAENKIHQLTCAVEIGLRIPETLIGNDPAEIRAFLGQHADCIYKPLQGYVWLQEGRRRATYTARVREADLPNDPVLRAVPGIYQRRVEHAYEVRAQFFGRQCAAIKIDVSSHDCLDWRLVQGAIECCERANVPEDVQIRCLALMERLGLVSAGFDFLVGSDGEWTFLEANQAGQFLFLEDWCPELPVLDMFCEFLADPSPQWRYRPHAAPIRFAEFIKDYRKTDAELA
ncbi:hypothetical protein JR065_10570 [Xanthomonas sp. AmX2]|uniref:MvdC/MvdD family ATP grasp protein n=1 Tax=Xanthomonas sp. TaxID=29446 RepID=UPI00197CF487|nr:hypothetical protein [Xanthomonas sp.]MBN6150786.1 hypothetical protein [Xanthomonas sp.]